jgi:hypothetical protein
MNIQTVKLHDREKNSAWWQDKSPEDRLAEVERLRLEAGKFLYEYKSGFRRVLEIIRRK